MNFEGDVQRVQRALLKQALTKGIERNEEQCKVWSAYKNGHEKVTEALQTFQKELYRALMKGKLIHTNEVLASLGDGYFAKYSAAGATALCQRRIQKAEEMLKSLNAERDLFETRILASETNLFEEPAGGEIVEHWNEDQIAEWKKKHREKEKEYHEKLAKIRQEERKKIETEEDLFKRVDQLELEEELVDELNRLEDEKYEILRGELGEECYYESESSSESQEDDVNDEVEDSKEENKEVPSANKEEPEESSKDTRKHRKSVSFVDADTLKEEKKNSSKIEDESSKEDDILRIEFTHSENTPSEISEGDLIRTPAYIYRLFSRPKSILKRSPNDLTPVQDAPPEYSTDDEEDDDETVRPSAYENVILVIYTFTIHSRLVNFHRLFTDVTSATGLTNEPNKNQKINH
ncbi:unconventional prefoldin RPB5 interactor-like protein [Ceratina calcarata]|uniref:Unconventional prefoldin RPB5 interactor-like protein n=1 Tax=Ceratina calcarata TaxID=156304 RepID=A0AAJ7NA69_9HYME|nr:unconventional prefoldin RPB5 interactor-like protein [Ceratina calcarata]